MPKKDLKRYSVRLPPWHMKRLIWWAELKGQTIAGMWQNIVQARIEVNEQQIEDMAKEMAESEGMSTEEWKHEALRKNNYDG